MRLLSGGNQQKLIVAREIHDQAQVVVASQPTRGLDIGATEFVRDRLVEQRNAGKGVLLISADLEEIMALSRPHRRAVWRADRGCAYPSGGHRGKDGPSHGRYHRERRR